jgi:hypothetical protein
MEYPKCYGPDDVPVAVRTLVERLLPALVAGDHPALLVLQQQLAQLRVTKAELTGCGFFVDFELAEEVPLAEPPNFTGGHAVIRLEPQAVEAGWVLFVRNGRIDMFEGYTYGDDAWTEEMEIVSVGDVVPISPG